MARDAIRVGCSSWSRGLQSKRRDSVVVSCKVTVCDPINPVVNPIPVYSHLTRDNTK
jgi:hypothetical protein